MSERESVYEQRLLLGLPWHCSRRPTTKRTGVDREVAWTFTTTVLHTPDALQSFQVTNGLLRNDTTYEQLCVQYEKAYANHACECCIELLERGGRRLCAGSAPWLQAWKEKPSKVE